MSAVKKEGVKPWPEPVDGKRLLRDITDWVLRYVYIPPESARAVAAWVILTWFLAEVYIAPILALLSPTKRCGKTTLFDLLTYLVREPALTSGFGSTPASIFRLNHLSQPTFLIDEAERLGRNNDIVGLLNNGYRRGGTVHRCREGKNGGWDVERFDAFGFRAVAAIGGLWDTLMDRSIIIRMQRRPPSAAVERFDGRAIEEKGRQLASKIARFAGDHLEKFSSALKTVEFPKALNDREQDNWRGLLVVGVLAGGEWPSLLAAASVALCDGPDDGDPGERLIRDIHRTFEKWGWPEVLQSGELAKSLINLDESPWRDQRGGRGISAHKLANMLKGFGIGPKQGRDSGANKVRGYWLNDLQPVFDRYLPELGQVGHSSDDAASERPRLTEATGTEVGQSIPNSFNGCPSCPTLAGRVNL